MTSKYVVATWADAFGTWYARVYRINATPKATRERARRAIVSELRQRGPLGVRYSVPLERVTRDNDTVTYREKVTP